MVTTADIKLLPYFSELFPVRPRFQGPGSTSPSVPQKAFDNAHTVQQPRLDPTRRLEYFYKENRSLHTYNAKRQVAQWTVHPAGRLIDTYA